MTSQENIEPQVRLISALSETMNNRMWADDLLYRCKQIRDAVQEIEKIAITRVSVER